MVTVVVIGWRDIGATEARVVREVSREGSTCPIITLRASIVKGAIVDVPGIREVVGRILSNH